MKKLSESILGTLLIVTAIIIGLIAVWQLQYTQIEDMPRSVVALILVISFLVTGSLLINDSYYDPYHVEREKANKVEGKPLC